MRFFFYLLKDVNLKKEAMMRFMNAMHSIAKVTGRDVATAFDLSDYRTACDVGGSGIVYILYMKYSYRDKIMCWSISAVQMLQSP